MKFLEVGMWSIGLILLVSFVLGQAWAENESRRSLAGFAAARGHQVPSRQQSPHDEARSDATVERPATGSAIAVLRIPGIKLEVPVGDGTLESVLVRGAGLIEGTAAPGSLGNVGIAAHRDSFFRSLEHVAIGDLIELDTPDRTHRYKITDLSVVDPTDVHVLDDTGESVLTLVTCYPFYFVGNAPQRFIVRAEAADILL
jgi:sortase A